MKYCRFESEDGPQYGRVEEREGEFWVTAVMASPWAPEAEASPEFVARRLYELPLLPPVAPSKILCVGRNYLDHAKELGNEPPAEPLLFFKPPSSLVEPGGVIRLPQASQRVDFEGELAVVIAQKARKLRRDENLAPYIHGYTL